MEGVGRRRGRIWEEATFERGNDLGKACQRAEARSALLHGGMWLSDISGGISCSPDVGERGPSLTSWKMG